MSLFLPPQFLDAPRAAWEAVPGGTPAGRTRKDTMKRLILAIILVSITAALLYVRYPEESRQNADVVKTAALSAWDGVQANPVPVAFAVGTFLLTVVYHKAKGKSLRESVEAAATRVTVVPVPVVDTRGDENAVVRRAKARAMRAQLLTDQHGIQNRQRRLPEELQKAERDACYSEQALAEAERKLGDKRKAHDEAVAKLEALRKEKAASEAELAEIDSELKRLAEMV